MTRDRLARDAQKLFDAARHELPTLAARERTLAALAVVPRERRQRVWRWFAIAGVAASVAVFVQLLRAEPGAAPPIGPERQARESARANNLPAVEKTGPVASDAPIARKLALPVPSVTRQAPSPAAAASLGLEQELELLDRARNALVSAKAAEALQLLDRYQALPQAKSMGAEATLLRIQALSSSGRAPDADKLARVFVEANPNSPLADRARQYITSEKEPGGKPAKSERP